MISVQHVRKWYIKLKRGCGSIVGESHSGRLISVADKILENIVDMIIQCDQKTKLSDIVYEVNVAYGTVKNIVTKKLSSPAPLEPQHCLASVFFISFGSILAEPKICILIFSNTAHSHTLVRPSRYTELQ